ncbi:MAG: SMP-30/gluconolactonase/LRE family protein [Roseiarcus sp.]|uniref:ABC transporter permease n=1 Tax=Roseiarcus sp. TaxID=1969460 RepID=UPI003C52DD4B
MTIGEWAGRLRYRYVPDHVVGEVLGRRWTDNVIPVTLLVALTLYLAAAIPNFISVGNINDTARQIGEFGLVVIGMTIVMLAGGIDLSVGSNFALANVTALALINVAKWPVEAAIPATLGVGALVGLINGFLIGFLRLRAFLTTLVVLTLIRAVVDLLLEAYSVRIASSDVESPLWDFVGAGSVLGAPFSFVLLIVTAIVAHFVLTRLRIGWRLMAVGGSRRAAYNAGISVPRTVCLTYVVSGVLSALAGTLYAARLSGAGPDTGIGLELTVVTAALIGGNSVGGGRGSVGKALMGAIIVSLLLNGLVRLGLPNGASSMVVGAVLLIAIAIDVRWIRWRHSLRAKVYVSPAYLALPAAPLFVSDPSSPYAMNDRLRDVEVIGLGEVDGPEDVILDLDDNVYCSLRQGEIVRFLAPDYTRREVYAHVGGRPLGMAFDRDGSLVVCIAGMGLYRVNNLRKVEKMTAETNRTRLSIIDDSRMRLADDLDIAPDGKVYFSEATIRYGFEEWVVDALEGRGNGRIIRYDPATGLTRTIIRNLLFANGVCMAHDNKSLLFAETWGCRISRYWLEGSKQGTTEVLVADLPGYPDNINRGSRGTYWLGLAGTRTPSYDMAMTMPAFRRRMARRVAADEWLFPNVNVGCVVHFDENGRVLESLWDQGGENHPAITSMREHRGFLYLGGVTNNRIGRIRLAGADPDWTGQSSYWGIRR